jgi:PAS domain S-box-containing protein
MTTPWCKVCRRSFRSSRLIVIFAVLAWSIIVPLAGAQTNALPNNRTAITAVIIHDSPPTTFRDPKTNKAAGFAVDVMDEIARRAGLAVSYRFEHDWTAIVDAVRTGKADIAPGMGITEERQKALVFTLPIDTFPVSIFVRSKSAISELGNGISVGVVKGSAAFEAIKQKYSNVVIKSYEGFSDGLFDLLAGNIDAFCCPAPTLIQLARDAGFEDRIKIVGTPLEELKRGIALRKADVDLLARLNTVVNEFVGSAEYQRIYTKWYGKPKPFLAVSRETVMTVFIIFFAMGAMALWRYISVAGLNRKLQQEIADGKRMEETLREGEAKTREAKEHFEAMFNTIPDAVLITRLHDGLIIDLNEGCMAITGFTREDIIGKSTLEVNLWKNPADRQKLFNELGERGFCENFEAHFHRKDGSELR